MLKLTLSQVTNTYTSALPATYKAVKNLYIPASYRKLYNTNNKVDIIVGEALNIRMDVINYLHNGSDVKLINAYSEAQLAAIDEAISTVVRHTKNFYDTIAIISQMLGE